MKFFGLPILIIWMLAASLAAQPVKTTPPNAKVSDATFDKPEKMLFRGSIFFKGSVGAILFEMTLVNVGEDLRGSYFFVKFGRASASVVRGKIQADGKILLREFDRANRAISEFRGALIENQDCDLEFNGDWKSNSRKKLVNFSAGGQIIEFTGKRRIETEYISEKNLGRRVQINAEYPQIRGENLAVIRKFNLTAKNAVIEPVAEFKSRMRRQTAEDIKNLPDEGNIYSISSDIKFADNHLVSVIYFYSESSGGEPQPFDYVGTLNYDLGKNRELDLADLFKPGAKYLETISAYCIKILQNQPSENGRELTGSDWAKGITADIENYDNWNLTRKGLLITFNDYQLLSFAGEQSVLIPYSELKRIAAPGSALARMAR